MYFHNAIDYQLGYLIVEEEYNKKKCYRYKSQRPHRIFRNIANNERFTFFYKVNFNHLTTAKNKSLI